MAPSQLLLLSGGPICRRCLLACARGVVPVQRRAISRSYLAKKAAAAKQWEERAELIKEGKLPNTWDLLEQRGFVKDTAGSRDTIREIMRTKRIGAYVGIDPTASSLHVGHLLPLMPLFWLYMHGYGAHTLIGGSTVKIGDPTDRLKTRDPISSADLAMNLTKMHFQIKKLWMNVEGQARRFGYQKEWAWKRSLVNNNTWWNSLPMLEVLKRIGTSIRIGPMLSRDTVKNKMKKGDGVSFAEFSYPLMQGWDWWTLFEKHNVQMQIGGSDQYGNIITGIEIVKTARASEPDPAKKLPFKDELDDPVGFTVPLLTDSSGAKFGKSAGNAVWLDQFMTPTFDLYGYFVRRPDADVENLLKLFTFLPLAEIQQIMEQQMQDQSKRVAQHRLAYEVVTLVHGEEAARTAQEEHRQMYGGGIVMPLTKAPGDEYAEPEEGKKDINHAPRIDMILPESLIMGKSIARILYAAGLAKSTSEANRLAIAQGIYIGGVPGQRPKNADVSMNPSQLTWNTVKLWFPQETRRYLIDGKILLLRKGKHNIRVIQMVSDEEYAKSGQTYPGQPYTGAVRQLREHLKNMKDGQQGTQELKAALAKAEAEEQAAEAAEKGDGFIKFPKTKSRQEREIEAEIAELARDEAGSGNFKP